MANREAVDANRAWRHPNALAGRSAAFWIGPLAMANLVLLVVAWFLPIMTLTKFWFWSDRVSLWETASGLLLQGEILLFLIVAGFSMIFPAVKLLAAGWVWARVDAASPGGSRAVRLMEALGRWSMIDVFVFSPDRRADRRGGEGVAGHRCRRAQRRLRLRRRRRPVDRAHGLDRPGAEESGRRLGAARGTRTPDPLITNQMLYQLSYCGAAVSDGHRYRPADSEYQAASHRASALSGSASPSSESYQ